MYDVVEGNGTEVKRGKKVKVGRCSQVMLASCRAGLKRVLVAGAL